MPPHRRTIDMFVDTSAAGTRRIMALSLSLLRCTKGSGSMLASHAITHGYGVPLVCSERGKAQFKEQNSLKWYLLCTQYPVHNTQHPVLYLQFVGSTINNAQVRMSKTTETQNEMVVVLQLNQGYAAMPEQVSTNEHGQMLKRIQTLEHGTAPAKEATNWKMDGRTKEENY